MALELAEETDSLPLQAQASYRLANAFNRSGNIKSASTYYEKSSELSDILEDDGLRAQTLSAYGVMLVMDDQFIEGEDLINQALVIATTRNDTRLIRICTQYLAISLQYQGAFDSALKYYDQCLLMASEALDAAMISIAHKNIAQVRFEQGRYDEANTAIRKAIGIRKERHEAFHLAKLYNMLLLIEQDRGDLDRLVATHREFIDAAAEHGILIDNLLRDDLQDVARTIERLRDERSQKRMLIGGTGAGVLILLGFGLYINERRKKNLIVSPAIVHEAPSGSDEFDTLAEHIKPLTEHKNKMLVQCYFLLAAGMNKNQIAEMLRRDRTTVYNWIKEIEQILKIENAQEDALRFGHQKTPTMPLVK